MACGNNEVSRDHLVSQPSTSEGITDRMLTAARQVNARETAPASNGQVKPPFPKAEGRNWYSKYNQRGEQEVEVLLDQDGQPTTGRPHIHVIHDEMKGEVRMHITAGTRNRPQRSDHIVLTGNVSGNEVNAAVAELVAILNDRAT
jgi:hypothetical protein